MEGSLEGKREALEALSGSGEAVILSSSLRVGPTEAGSWVPSPERLAGFSGLPPFAARGRIELQRGLRTDDLTWTRARAFFTAAGLEVDELGDHPGGVQARLVCCIINEAAGLLAERGASGEDLDTAMMLGTNYPRGPLAWADAIGLDRVLAVLEGLEREYREDRYRVTPLLRKMVLAGRLGTRSGQGFFRYRTAAVEE